MFIQPQKWFVEYKQKEHGEQKTVISSCTTTPLAKLLCDPWVRAAHSFELLSSSQHEKEKENQQNMNLTNYEFNQPETREHNKIKWSIDR